MLIYLIYILKYTKVPDPPLASLLVLGWSFIIISALEIALASLLWPAQEHLKTIHCYPYQSITNYLTIKFTWYENDLFTFSEFACLYRHLLARICKTVNEIIARGWKPYETCHQTSVWRKLWIPSAVSKSSLIHILGTCTC